MARVMNVVLLTALVAGCMGQADPVQEAMSIADQLNDEVQGDTDQVQLNEQEPKDKDEKKDTEEAKAAPNADAAQVEADAENANIAAKTAKQAAKVATKVAKHSVKITEHAKSALKNAHDALHRARVDTEGLSSDQKDSLKIAEKKLREATKDAEYGQVKDAKYTKAKPENEKLEKLEKKMEDVKEKKKKTKKEVKKGEKPEEKEDNSELEAMRKELAELRKKLEEQGDDSDDDALKELQKQIEDMEKAESKEDKVDAKSHDEMKAEIERLRDMIKSLEEKEAPAKEEAKKPRKEKAKGTTHPLPPSPDDTDDSDDPAPAARVEESPTLDIDTAMPYGDLEPFGREDTAQELTESSIKESDEMVDQLERAEVAEEKRAVFRALTRLRGAAITSFDGVARSQTGNIDEYNKIHQWRGSHPLHHLADEESDVSKWAFPDNAD